jgi:hypothetical protein
MSRVLNIIVEGPTEREFVNNCMYPYFFEHNVSNVRPIGIETSPGHKGGDVRYQARFKPNVLTILRGKEDLLVTSFIDFYRLRADFPRYDEAQRIADVQRRVEFLEQSCYEDIGDERFIPYIQLHDFEALLFTKADGFQDFRGISAFNSAEIGRIIEAYPNPELINDTPGNAPSKRLERLIGPTYQKPFHGPYIAMINGFDAIMDKCPRFNRWVTTLIQRMNA